MSADRAYGDTAAARRGVGCACSHGTNQHEGDEYGFCLACSCNHYRPVIRAAGRSVGYGEPTREGGES